MYLVIIFFLRLKNKLKKSQHYNIKSKTVLVNVSISILELLRLKLQGGKIVMRLDGAYHDSINHLEYSNSKFFKQLGRLLPNSNILNYLFNLLYENWKVEIRLSLVNAIVYQSEFSQKSHQFFLFAKYKSSIVIPNSYVETQQKNKGDKVLIILGKHKRKNDKQALYLTLKYCKINDMSLKIVGWKDGNNDELNSLISDSLNDMSLQLIEKYDDLDQLKMIANDCKYFVFLSYRDPCPNVLLETISFGLLPITVDSGGIGEMLPSEYPLIKFEDNYGFYSPARYSERLPIIDFTEFAETFDKVKLLNKKDMKKNQLMLSNIVKVYEGFLLKVNNDRK